MFSIEFNSAEIKMVWGKCWFFMTWLEAGSGQHSDDAEAVSVTIVLILTPCQATFIDSRGWPLQATFVDGAIRVNWVSETT